MSDPLEEIIRLEGGRVVATLGRMTGNLDLAEDALSDAVVVALERWPIDGVPDRPGAWLTTVARRKALDRLRREARRTEKEERSVIDDPDPLPASTIRDDQLRLVFTCCHPALAPEARVALALRTLCGLTTAEIAAAFLVSEPTMGQRISRAKAKLRANHVRFRVPDDAELPARLTAVLAVVNVVFTTGHHAPHGTVLARVDLTEEAIRLARLLVELMPDEPEALGLLALLLSTAARSPTRVDDDGDLVLLPDADRSRWDAALTTEAVHLVDVALRRDAPGPYQLRAAISVLHTVAPDAERTDWPQIVTLYRLLESIEPSVPVRVNRALAEAEVDGPERGLELLDALDDGTGWHLRTAARADLLRRAGRTDEAVAAYRLALEQGPNDVDARFLRRRIAELTGSDRG